MFLSSFFRKLFSAFCILSLLFISIDTIVFASPVHAQEATSSITGNILANTTSAVPAIPTTEIGSIPVTIGRVLDLIKEGFVNAAALGFKNATRAFLEKIAYDTAVFLASAGENQTPLITTQTVGAYIQSAGDAALGEFLNTISTENGLINLNLCDLPTLEKLQFNIILPKLLGQEPAPTCSFSEIKESFSDYADNFSDQWKLIMDDPSTLFTVSLQYDNGDNAISSLINGFGQAIGEQQKAREAAEAERIKSDFQDLKDDISGYINTPSEYIGFQAQATINQATQAETIYTDHPVADAFMVFTRTLSSKLMERLASGLVSFFTSTDIADSLSGNSSTAGAGAGVAGAQEQYASYKTASFNTGGSFDILTQFVSCPSVGADVVNCTINESLRIAIEEQLTLKQAVDQGLINPSSSFAFDSSGAPIEDPTNGIPYRSVAILKQYNVVPVGWVLAADYMRDFSGNAATIQELMDSYDNCDASNYSPYCGLIDPNWTLKAPEAYCKAEGYGEVIANQQFQDLDGSDYTPQSNLVSRLTSCLDAQSCLSEDESGACEAYGYCTKQEAIYQFQGDSCPEYMASCDTYEDSESNTVSYLTNTVNFNDCSADSVGCQWYCTVYNDVDSAFQCSSQGMIYPTCTTDGGCSCTVGTETCTIANGGFQCATSSGATCTGTPVAESVEGVDSAISFDDDATACNSTEAGCTEFISFFGGANVISNPSFEHFNAHHVIDESALLELGDKTDDVATTPYDDTFGFYGTNGLGAPCTETSGSQTCYGWQLISGARARAVSNSTEGNVAIQLDSTSSGFLTAVMETGSPLANRTFSLSYSYENDSASDCDAEYWVRPDDGSVLPAAISTTYVADASGFSRIEPELWTFGTNVTATAVRVAIAVPADCDLLIDEVKLEENSVDSGYTAYGDSNVLTFVNMSKALTCAEDEVSCELYTPVTGESDISIPGIITNPLASVCGNGTDFSDPSCSQCEEEFVGCDAYIPVASVYSAPIRTVAGFDDPTTIDADLAAGIAQRTGYYCEGTSTACSPERAELDCGSSSIQCLPSISIIPSTGTQCSVQNVGCEEYVNVDAQAAGGEGLEYYSYIRQCVKPSDAQESADSIDTFYTFEGSDVSGYQIRSWYLKQSNLGQGPCTNLDLFGSSSQTTSADCIDTATNQQTCTAADVGVNPDCTEFYDDSGQVYYILASTTITVSDECEGLRNTLDDRLYYSIVSESTTCPASENLCQEFKGSEGDAVNNIVDDNFDTETWTQGESSSTVITASTGQSMAIGAGTTNGFTSAYTDVSSVLDTDTSYIVTFWAKASEANTTLTPYFESGTAVSSFEYSATLTTEWKRYQLGPVALSSLNGDEVFGFASANSSGSATYIVYIDNVLLSESHSHYLIANTARMCYGYEGCEQYTDTANVVHYLKSFTKLCDESVVGCQSVIATQHSDNPFYEQFNVDNEYAEDDVAVAEDVIKNIVITDEVLCSSDVASCTAFGLPDLDASEQVQSFTTAYILNDPDEYDTTLCQEQQRSCEEYTDSSGTTVYFKNPDDKVCTYNSADGEWQTPDGTACPLQNADTSAAPSQPKGAICNGGLREGAMCSSDAECPNADGITVSRCVSNQDENSGWVGQCSDGYAGCTLYVDPNPSTEIENAQFEADVKDNYNITSTTPDDIPDSWTEESGNAFYRRTNTDATSAFAALISADELVPCAQFAQASSEAGHVFDREHSLKMQSDSAYGRCLVSNDEFIPVDTNSIYTLSGQVYLEDTSDAFAIGLLFYDASYEEIETSTDPTSYAFAAYEGPDRDASETVLVDQWMRFYGAIGPNLTHTFPEGTYYVKAFIEVARTGTNSSVFFDAIQFGQNQTYTYISSTVDGSSESETNSCNGVIDIANGCVAFRDASNSALTSLASIQAQQEVNGDSYSATACTFNDGTPSEACDSRANMADSNVVIQVQNDRQCSEWLTCIQSRPNYDDQGNLVSTTCLQIGRCSERNEDTGECIEIAPLIASNALGYDDDISAISQPGNVDSLNDIHMLSGFSTVGTEWIGVCSEGLCVGGGSNGNTCTTNDDCDSAQIEYGYYTPDSMAQLGTAGANATEDVVPQGDFEDVFCTGDTTYDNILSNSDGESLDGQFATLENARDTKLSCTLDSQCRTTATESKLESILDLAELSVSIESIFYSQGWCDNVDQASETWGESSEWSTSGSSTMVIIDYQNIPEGGSFYTPATNDSLASIANDQYATAYGSGRLDFNNVLLVSPENNDEGGVQVNLGSVIGNDQSYVVSFDAQYMNTPEATDFIQIGLAHGDDTADVDYFERGSSMADIVFIVDASSSMASYINNVASATSDLISNLETAGINYQTAIVTTGGTREPKILDFDEYTTGPLYNYQGSDGLADRDFTTDTTEFSDAMEYIADNLDAGAAYNYDALVDVASGIVNGQNIGFRSGAMKFVILLTDVASEGGTYTDESSALNAIDGAPYILNAIVASGAADAYDDLASQYGGSQYDIATSDYSDILSAISSTMSDLVSEFKFSTAYEHYTLGPITVSHKEGDNDSTYLFIRQVAGSTNNPFVIDNISLLPALEVNKENNPNSDDSTWLISRDCRAYPGSESVACDYTDTAGTVYQGWKGYCLQHDTDISSTTETDESTRCVAWWPVDIIAGEPDNVSRDRVQYAGKTPVYTCLVGKGNATISVCANTSDGTDGLLCASDSQCGTGTCVGNSDEYVTGGATFTDSSSGSYSDAFTDTYDLAVKYDIANYIVKNVITELKLDAIDPDSSPYVYSADPDHETAFFHKFSVGNGDLPVESSIHISEIDDLHFYMGDPQHSSYIYNGNTYNLTDDEKNQANLTWHAGTADFNLRRDLYTQSSQLFKHESLFLNGTDGHPSTDATGWFYQCSGDANDPDCMAIYSSQKAAWCGGVPCNSDSTEEEWDDVDFTFVKAVMPKTEDTTLSTYIDPTLNAYTDPFTTLTDLSENSSAWSANSGKGASGIIQGNNSVEGHSFDKGFFQSEESGSANNAGFSGQPTDYSYKKSNDTCFGLNNYYCGANIVGVKFDFDNGYLKNVYLFYWAGMRNLDPVSIDDAYWEFALNEPCLLAVQTVDTDANTIPWMTRVSGTPSYILPDINVPYHASPAQAAYGAIGLTDPAGVSQETDSSTGAVYKTGLNAFEPSWVSNSFQWLTSTSGSLPFVGTAGSNGTGVPLACIGTCNEAISMGDDSGGFGTHADPADNNFHTETTQLSSMGSTGVYGVCSDSSAFCSTDDDCNATFLSGAVCVQGDWSNKGTSGDTYYEQLRAAAKVAWERYRLLFPTLDNAGGLPTKLSQSEIFYAPINSDVNTTEFGYMPKLQVETIAESPLNLAFDEDSDGIKDFEEIPNCGVDPREDDEYCYVKPTVADITVNGNLTGDIEMQSGTFVSLEFDSDVDADQQPLKTIYIEWLGDVDNVRFNSSGTASVDPWEAASTTGHTYSYAYTCDPSSEYWNSTKQACEYQLRIEIQDNWGFCSGATATSTTRVFSGADACTSYDAYNGKIYVKP